MEYQKIIIDLMIEQYTSFFLFSLRYRDTLNSAHNSGPPFFHEFLVCLLNVNFRPIVIPRIIFFITNI